MGSKSCLRAFLLIISGRKSLRSFSFSHCVFLAQDSVRHVCSVFNSSHANSSPSSMLFSTDSCLVILVWLCSRQFNNFGTHERISVHVAFAWVCKIVLMVQYHVEHFNMTLNSGYFTGLQKLSRDYLLFVNIVIISGFLLQFQSIVKCIMQ